MSLYQRMRAEARRRAEVLPQEVKAWKDVAQKDVANPLIGIGKKGITGRQLGALEGMMGELQERQTALLKELDADLKPEQFAAKYLELADEIASANEIWRIFRYIILLHKDDRLGPLVDAADLVAADCYLACMERMREWGLVKLSEFRETPLVYLEAEVSPQTVSRGKAAGALGFALRRYRDKKLPIPITLLPSDHASSLWLHSTLHHEVGHNLDQELNVSGEMRPRLLGRLAQKPDERQRMWCSTWVQEIVADTFGVLLGGAGFAYALGWWLLALAPEARYAEWSETGEHPPPYIRVHLLAALLRGCNVPEFTTAADALLAEWGTHQKPAWVGAYTQDGDDVAAALLTEPLPKLGGRPLNDLIPDLAGDAQRAAALASYLLSGFLRPDTKLAPGGAPGIRLVPVAAQLAFVSAPRHDAAVLDRIHDRAMQYLSDLPRPQMMSVAPDRTEYFRRLVRELDLSH